jgi:hypothetical protein
MVRGDWLWVGAMGLLEWRLRNFRSRSRSAFIDTLLLPPGSCSVAAPPFVFTPSPSSPSLLSYLGGRLPRAFAVSV